MPSFSLNISTQCPSTSCAPVSRKANVRIASHGHSSWSWTEQTWLALQWCLCLCRKTLPCGYVAVGQCCSHLCDSLSGCRETCDQTDRCCSICLSLQLAIRHLDHPVGHLGHHTSHRGVNISLLLKVTHRQQQSVHTQRLLGLLNEVGHEYWDMELMWLTHICTSWTLKLLIWL